MSYLKFNGKTYEMVSLDSLTLKQTMMLQAELSAASWAPVNTFQETAAMARQFSRMSEDEQRDHPHGMFLTVVTLWAVINASGERMTLDELTDFTLVETSKIEFFGDSKGPSDHKPPSGKASAGRRGSAKKTTSATSARKSSPVSSS